MGDRAYIPKTWALMTNPTMPRSCPWSVMCSGVMVMMSTITTWPAMSATIAVATAGRRMRVRRSGPGVAVVARSSTRSSASSYGSGRSQRNDSTAAARTKTTVTT